MSSLPSTVPPARAYSQQPFSYPQAYGQYPSQQYPPVNYSARPQGLAYSAFQVPFGRKDPTSWIDSLPPQELSSVDPEVASKVLSRFISAELKYEAFDSAEPVALERLEVEVINCAYPHPTRRRLTVLSGGPTLQLFRNYTARSTITRILPTGPHRWLAICLTYAKSAGWKRKTCE